MNHDQLHSQAKEREKQTQQWGDIEAIWASIFKKGATILVCQLPRRYIDQSFSSVLRPEVCELHCRVYVCVLFFFFFLNPAAEIMVNMLFNTLLKITLHDTQKKEKKKKDQRMYIHDGIRDGCPIQFLTRVPLLNQVSRGL